MRCISYFSFLVLRINFFQKRIISCRPILVFYETKNQKKSLDGLIEELKKRKYSVIEVVSKDFFLKDDNKTLKVGINIYNFLTIIFIFIFRFKYLYGSIAKKDLAREKIDVFLRSHFYLVYFYDLMKRINPILVISANDHNVSNKSLYAVADFFKIKTAYLQHASVSEIFPALDVDFAFLDGQIAKDIYSNCAQNKISTIDTSRTKIILSGQKKKIKKTRNTNFVGIAINKLDHHEDVFKLIEFLLINGFNTVVRWHPSMSSLKTLNLFEKFKDSKLFNISDPFDESVDVFLCRIKYLIASDSSIHLEAVLSDVVSIYYKSTPSDIFDYYGYVRNGLSKYASSYNEIIKLMKNDEFNNIEAIRCYSSTYKTNMESREGELVADFLENIISKEIFDN